MSTTSSHKADVKRSGHPAGIWVLCTTEMWERFAYYGMRALLVLYLAGLSTKITGAGFGWSKADALDLYAWYTSLVYLLPLLGGWIADRYLGQFRSVILGGSLMALGQFCLSATEFVRIGIGTNITWATDPTALMIFYAGLALMIIGNSFFKPCISVMVGQLYKPEESQKRDVGFSYFYMGINIGAFFSPLVAGTIGEIYGFHLGFMISGFGMLFGLCTFLFFRRYLKGLGLPPKRGKVSTKEMTEQEKAAHEKQHYEQTRPLVRKDYDRMFVIIVLTLFVVAFWMAFEQAGGSLTMFAKDNTNRAVPQAVIGIPGAKNVLIENEFRNDLEAEVLAAERLEGNIADILDSNEKKISRRESFGERVTRLFSFKAEKKATVEDLLERSSDEKRPDYFIGGELVNNAEKTERLTEKQQKELGVLLKTYKETAKRMSEQAEKTEKMYNPEVSGFTFPATWYQSANPLFVVIFAPLFILVWGFLAKRGIEPSTPLKFAIGVLMLSIGFFLMIPAAIQEQHSPIHLSAPYWLLWCYIFSTWGELCLSPVGLSMVSKLAPARYASLFMGVWFLSSFVGNFLAGKLAAIFERGGGIHILFGKQGGMADFFLIMAVIPAIIGFVALLMVPMLKKKMHGIN
ncbi:MAG: oligopeptide:H+ symporter [Planctomycetaceae bacterium]|jgi:POT family proton-dependent oligopeptide transporter|nr:oligopeptide:H+ symporter [Planctomycetaceae bacterium]